jgi:hypothetical protein
MDNQLEYAFALTIVSFPGKVLRAARFLAGALLLGIGLASSMVCAGQDVPPGWVAYYQQGSNLFVPHPANWKVQERGDGTFIAYLPGTGSMTEALVYVKPQRLNPNRNAADVLGLLPREEAALFPNARVLNATTVEAPRLGVIGTLAFTLQNQRFRGTALVLQGQATGTLFVLSATEMAWGRHAQTMALILNGFRYVSTSVARAPGSGALPQMVQWHDPAEGAFTLPVPSGWRVDGGMKRPNPLLYRPEVVLASPDDSIQLRLGDAAIPTFSEPYAVPMVGMMPEGTTTAGNTVLMRYQPGYQFLTQTYLPSKFGIQAGVQVENLPALAAQSFQLRPPAQPMQGRADAGAVRFDIQLPIGPRRAYYVAITRYAQAPGLSGVWYVDLLDIAGYLCVPGLESQAATVLAAMYRGFAWNPNWLAAQARANAELAQTVSYHNREMSNITAQTIAIQSAGTERAQAPLGMAARGEIVVTNDQTGQTMRIPQTGSQDYFQINRTGEIIGSDNALLPPYDFTRLTRGMPN